MLLDAVAVRPLALAGMLLGLPLSRRSILLLAHPPAFVVAVSAAAVGAAVELLWVGLGQGGPWAWLSGWQAALPPCCDHGCLLPLLAPCWLLPARLAVVVAVGAVAVLEGPSLGLRLVGAVARLVLLVLGWVGLPSASAGCCLLPLVCRQGLPAPRSLPRHWLVLAVAVEVEAGQWGLSPGLWLGGVAVWLLLSVLGPVRPPVVLVGFWGAVPPMPRGGVLAPRQLQRVASSLVPGSLLGLLLCVPSAQRGLQRGTEFSPSACKWPPPPPRRLPSVATRVLGGVLTCWVSCLELGAGCGVSAHRLLGQAR